MSPSNFEHLIIHRKIPLPYKTVQRDFNLLISIEIGPFKLGFVNRKI